MRPVRFLVGSLFLLCACGYAQNSVPETSTGTAATTLNNSTSSMEAASAPTQGQDRTTESSSSKDANKASEHHTHIRLGGIAVSAGYTHFPTGPYPNVFPYDPFYYPFAALTWWDPLWGLYPAFPVGSFSRGNEKGELKLSGVPKNASVYVNHSYAGTADHLKSFWLDPGAYDLEVYVPGGRHYEQRVFILTGKTLRIDAKLLVTMSGGQL